MVRDARVAVVGGSIAGCAAAIAAGRAGCEVTLFERSSGDLAERGFGLVMPNAVREQLLDVGYLGPDMPVLTMRQRLWLTRQPQDSGVRELWWQKVPATTCNWGLLWRALRAGVPGTVYRAERAVTAVRTAGERAVVTVDGRDDSEFDLVVGADGHRSLVRGAVVSGAAPVGADYLMVRGVRSMDALVDDADMVELLSDTGLTVLFDGGHLIAYLIPDGKRGTRLNWAMYLRPPEYAPRSTEDDAIVRWVRASAADWLPDAVARFVTHTSAIAVHAVSDLPLDTLAAGPCVLLGDAATLARPHSASGAVKAMQDALSLGEALSEHSSIREATAAYDAQRRPVGNDLVALSRRIGRDQVEAPPDWTTMDAEAMAGHVTATWSGQPHYLAPSEG